MKSKFLTGFVLSVTSTAVAVLVMLPVDSLGGQWNRLWPLAALALIAGTRTVRLPFMRVQATTTHPLVLIAIGALGPAAAVLTGLAGVVGAALGRRWPTMLQFGFNSGAMVLAASAGSFVFDATGGSSGMLPADLVWPLFAANTTFFIVNIGLLTIAIVLEKQYRLVTTWRRSLSWSAGSYLAGFSFAVGVLALFDVAMFWAIALAVPPCWLLIVFYRMLSEQPAFSEPPPVS